MWCARVILLLCLVPGITLAQDSRPDAVSSPAIATASAALQTLDSPRRGAFLVAPRAMGDPRFRHSIVFLVAHGAGGSLGLIVNRRGDIRLSETVPDLATDGTDYPLYFGGPVGLPMVLMLARGSAIPEGMERISEEVYISSEQPVLEAALAASGDDLALRFYIGYAGWAPGQLDGELAQNGWHIIAGDADAIFSDEPGELWYRLIDRLEPPGLQAWQAPLLPRLAIVTTP